MQGCGSMLSIRLVLLLALPGRAASFASSATRMRHTTTSRSSQPSMVDAPLGSQIQALEQQIALLEKQQQLQKQLDVLQQQQQQPTVLTPAAMDGGATASMTTPVAVDGGAAAPAQDTLGGLSKLDELSMASLSMPSLSMPSLSMPSLPMPSLSLPSLSLPSLSMPSLPSLPSPPAALTDAIAHATSSPMALPTLPAEGADAVVTVQSLLDLMHEPLFGTALTPTAAALQLGAIALFSLGAAIGQAENSGDAPYKPGTSTYDPKKADTFYAQRPLLVAKRLAALSYLTSAFTAGVLWDWLVLGKLLKDEEYTALKAAEPRRVRQPVPPSSSVARGLTRLAG